MEVKVKYDGRSVGLEEFLQLDISADIKRVVWRENNVSEKLFPYLRRIALIVNSYDNFSSRTSLCNILKLFNVVKKAITVYR